MLCNSVISPISDMLNVIKAAIQLPQLNYNEVILALN